MSTDIYQAIIMDRSKTPRFAGALLDHDHAADGNNPMCGDRTKIFVKRDGMKVAHESKGCAILLASADLMAEAVTGMDVTEVQTLSQAFETTVTTGVENQKLGNLNALAGVHAYRSRIRCATLPWAALRDALTLDQLHGR
jgi:nitrogen fixation NifU-like protein